MWHGSLGRCLCSLLARSFGCINYADDFVICCRGTAEEAMNVMRMMMSKRKLTVNEQKTRLCHLPEESFDFLGYTLGRHYDCRTGESYVGPRPAQKKVDRLCSARSMS